MNRRTIGGMVGVVSRNGGMVGIVNRITPYANSPKRGQAIIGGLGNRTKIVVRRGNRERTLTLRGRLTGLTLAERE